MTAREPRTLRLAIISDAAPGRNGVGAYYHDLTKHLETLVDSVSVFSPTIRHGQWQASLVLPMPGDDTQKVCVPNPRSIGQWLDRAQPHAVIVPTPGPYGLAGTWAARRRNLPVIVGFHTSFEHLADLYWHGSLFGRLANRYFDAIHRYLFRRSTRVLAHSEPMVRMARELGANNPALVGTPIPPDFLNPDVVPFSGTLRRCLFAGRLAAEKRVECVFAAARAHPDIAFTVAGTGPLRDQVAAESERLENLTYLGWLSRMELRHQVDQHDALLLPSHFESFGTVALEAMARQRIAIVSDGCGIGQWPQLAAHLSIFQDEATLIDRLATLKTSNPVQLRDQAHGSHRAALAMHDHCISQWLDLLDVQSMAGKAA